MDGKLVTSKSSPKSLEIAVMYSALVDSAFVLPEIANIFFIAKSSKAKMEYQGGLGNREVISKRAVETHQVSTAYSEHINN